MAEDNNKIFKIIKYILIFSIILMTLLAGMLAVSGLRAMISTPDVNPDEINTMMSQTSEILDQDGNLIKKIQTTEHREIVDYSQIPKYMSDAFIAVEDERFESHKGVDPKGILGAFVQNLRAGGIVRGGSTLAQQLARNLYLTNERSFDRKFKEIYLALQLTDTLGREKVFETYMNTVFLGQNAYGVEAAAQTYFDKSISELNLSECATLAGIVKSPSSLALYKAIEPGQVEDQTKIVGDVEIEGETYKAVYNEQTIQRRDYVLYKMLETGKISQAEYDEAINYDVVAAIKPGIKGVDNLSNYYYDVVYNQVLNKLIESGFTEAEAHNKLVNGGLKIYACVDQEMQKNLEEVFDKTVDEIVTEEAPSLFQWSGDDSGNITNQLGEVIYFKQANLINENDEFYIPSTMFTINPDNSITFTYDKNIRVKQYGNYLDLKDYYTINENNNLVSHKISSINVGSDNLSTDDDGNITISASYMNDNNNLASVDQASGDLIFNKDYYTIDQNGIKQPQAATTVVDHSTGYIKAIVGGRSSIDNADKLNRAYDVPRQVGSSMKPLGVYTPALDNGYTAATGVDDIPHYNEKGELWPQNWYLGYKGIVPIRYAVEQSINVVAVKVLEDIGLETSKTYLEKFGLINKNNPKDDNFVSSLENPNENDENVAAMALGALTSGFTPTEMAGAYSAIANDGKYIEPISFTKVEDSSGQVIIENTQKTNEVVSPQIAYVMKDILRTTTNYNYATNAQLEGFDIGGKSGTTNDYQDVWFCGFSPYYTISTWLGFDNQQLKMEQISQETVVRIWSAINRTVLADKDYKQFEEPEGMIRQAVCTVSGKLPTDACYSDPREVVREEIFAEGTVPSEECDVHTFASINTIDGLLATDRTPGFLQGYRSFITRKNPYIPSENEGIIPDDWQYMLPSSYSNNNISDSILNRFRRKDKDEKEEDKENEDSKENSDEKEEDKENENFEENSEEEYNDNEENKENIQD
ncbi:MAG: PBP1A family penicillin-binding protein [Finegoldia sp.]|nr:PBP1A family penicillin-binding protein [Finegoldia sp.]